MTEGQGKVRELYLVNWLATLSTCRLSKPVVPIMSFIIGLGYYYSVATRESCSVKAKL